jgi:hypothetical protein
MVNPANKGGSSPFNGNSQSPEGTVSPVRQNTWQKNAGYLQPTGRLRNLAAYNLFVLIGPTTAGKSTGQANLKSLADVTNAKEEVTRKKRKDGQNDPWYNHLPSHAEFHRRRKAGEYFHSYHSDYRDEDGTVTKEYIGIRNDSLLPGLDIGDVMTSFTDPDAYLRFSGSEEVAELSQSANIIPIGLIPKKKKDMATRLDLRECSEEHDKSEDDWEKFSEINKGLESVVTNFTDERVTQHIEEHPDKVVPHYIEEPTYPRIDYTAKMLADIVNFYKWFRTHSSAKDKEDFDPDKFDVHEEQL